MKPIANAICVSAALIAGQLDVSGQVRKDIFDPFFDPGTGHDRTMLFDLMEQYITGPVIENHRNVMMTSGGMIHSDFDFLPFHRVYLEGMEDFLINAGHPEFVPLPSWNPAVAAPIEFQQGGVNADGIDPDCSAVMNCPGWPPTVCTPVANWDPQNDRFTIATHITLPTTSGWDLCDWDMDPMAPGMGMDCCQLGLSRQIEGPNALGNYHNNTHVLMGGVMDSFPSPAAPIFWLWHAYVDDIWKEWEEFCHNSTTQPVDLYMKDTPMVVESERDRGEEPNIDGGPMWVSEDIWVRNTNDGGTEHQDPEYYALPGNFNYVYVRVRNRGYQDSPGGELLNVYWAKAATALAWPAHWNGSIVSPAPMGALIGTVPLPPIPAGASRVVSVPWQPENPADYLALWTIDPLLLANEPNHFCLLARIDPASEPMTTPEGGSVYDNTRNNNNIVWKNVSVIDADPFNISAGGDDKLVGAWVLTGDAWGDGGTFDLVFQNPVPCKGNPITEEAEIRLTMDGELWELWADGGMQMENMAINREERYQLIVTGNPARMKNITYPPGRRIPAFLSFNFLVRELSGQERFSYDMIQQKTSGQVVGGERYDVRVLSRTPFQANAGPDQRISPSTSADLEAEPIGEPAIYNWYDPSGELIHTGKDRTVSPEITTKYKLEVIAEADGMKDYDKVEVGIKEHEITAVAPNPTTGSMQVLYRLTNASSAYLQLTAPYSGVSNQYILNTAGDQTTLDLSSLPPGTYQLKLVVNGQFADVTIVTVL